jgi:CheY-like chemotaxis protein
MINVLYVEDDERSRQVIKMVQRMNPESMELTIFEDSEDFEQQLLNLQPQPDMIFLDIHVRPLTGFQMLGIIRSHEQYISVPVIAMTASVMNEEVQTLKNVGFDGIFSKPLDLDIFPDLLQRVLQGERVWYVL